MALNIRNAEAEKLASDLAVLTGETKTEAVTVALRERLERVTRSNRMAETVAARLNEIARHCAALPVLDGRTPEEMLYDENGLPK